MRDFKIRCRKCGRTLREVHCAFCEHCVGALMVTEYEEREFTERGEGIWRFNWLPVRREGSGGFEASGPVVYLSDGLGPELGLTNLHIAFCGYWPGRGALMRTCTFKELEAAVVLRNASDNGVEGLVAASAGNTARAFAHLSTETGFPVIIVVPRMCLGEMWYLEASTLAPTLVVGDGDYSDAIDMARRVAGVADLPFEGGVKNIAKRDGLGVVLMEAVSSMGRLPEYYYQAVGSGAGAIAVWEMAGRFIRDGRFGQGMPRLHLAQNLPFAPMHHAWGRGERGLRNEDLDPALIAEISTRVLSSRYPAYSVMGGVYDALMDTRGAMHGVTNAEARAAGALFERTEGVDIVPAAAVAVGALVQSVQRGELPRDAHILLNITGGGEALLEEPRHRMEEGVFVSRQAGDDELREIVCGILKRG